MPHWGICSARSGDFYSAEIEEIITAIDKGGIISPILANMTLDGLESLLKSKFEGVQVYLVRYADDMIVTAQSKEDAEKVRSVIVEFLSERGLELSEEKTRIVHISEGFDFLGWAFRKFNGKMLNKPSKKSIKAIIQKIRAIISCAKCWTQDELISRLNPVIRGWTMYPRFLGTHNEVNISDEFTKIFILMGAIFLKLKIIAASLCVPIIHNDGQNFNLP